ncbi:Subtilisin-like protease [Rhynchospora pubera]|uniref:Subtilisin-like protease n=1 Tax=Rhynchospora pubera TaxID=906938 RepID=A0AAV8BQB4_9POAL|nr:Subtilisin-like protease [Rhynchospora pubera]
MKGRRLTSLVWILIFTIIQVSAAKKSYIVYLGSHQHGSDATPEDYQRAKNSHYKFLESYVGSEGKARDAIIYSYTKKINGFAATLEEKDAEDIAKHPAVVSVFPETIYKLQTTRSWSFLDMDVPENRGSIPTQANIGRNVIIATLDTGVWPESKSFSDEGMGPIPSKWRGFCDNSTKFGVPCNNKLIGAQFFNKGLLASNLEEDDVNSARDTEGHGTHTLSTAAGAFVPGATSFGYANGTARGGAPGAHVAAYKVCQSRGCSGVDILAGFDTALHDNVDIISVSLSAGPAYFGGTNFLDNEIALGSLHAAAMGITVVCSAGNDGPDTMTVGNVAPWVITVGASTIDRDFPSYVKLGNEKLIKGASQAMTSLPQNQMYTVINGSDAAAPGVYTYLAASCNTSSLDPEKVKGKIVVCIDNMEMPRIMMGMTVKDAGGAGMILINNAYWGDSTVSDPHVLPATMISYRDGATLYSYMKSTKNPLANISPKTTKIGVQAPSMAYFSSRGPSYPTPEILKPDVTAPGVDILAAFTEFISPTGIVEDERRTPFYLLSGTSMSCPHVSGLVAQLKSVHPDWSFSAIKSALMTTATIKDNRYIPMRDHSGAEATPLAYGNGHIRPNRAAHPGLVYDNTIENYLSFLCTLGYTSANLSGLINKAFVCPSEPMKLENLNYPSIAVRALNKSTVVTRTLKNVGPPGTYKVRVKAPSGVAVSVRPPSLSFSKVGDERSFTVALTSQIKNENESGFKFGRLVWTNEIHQVSSSIAVNVVA